VQFFLPHSVVCLQSNVWYVECTPEEHEREIEETKRTLIRKVTADNANFAAAFFWQMYSLCCNVYQLVSKYVRVFLRRK